MSNFSDGYRQGALIGEILTGVFKVVWFFTRIAWWLLVFLVLSLGAGVASLARRGRDEPEIEGSGKYSEDRTQWFDERSGKWYPCSQTKLEYCTVQAMEQGMYWRMTALSRLLRGGAMKRTIFLAIHDGNSDIVVASEFPEEARLNITLDHLDPALAATDQYGLSNNRDRARDALRELETILTAKGWKSTDRHQEDHWYARIYERPVIEWNKTIGVE